MAYTGSIWTMANTAAAAVEPSAGVSVASAANVLAVVDSGPFGTQLFSCGIRIITAITTGFTVFCRIRITLGSDTNSRLVGKLVVPINAVLGTIYWTQFTQNQDMNPGEIAILTPLTGATGVGTVLGYITGNQHVVGNDGITAPLAAGVAGPAIAKPYNDITAPTTNVGIGTINYVQVVNT